MKQTKKLSRKVISYVLALVMVLSTMTGIVPGMSMTALAWEGDPYASLVNTTTVVKFDNKDWYLIENYSTALNAGTVTLLSKECVAASQYYSSRQYVEYASSTVKTAVDNWYNENITSNAKTAVFDNKMFLLTIAQANAMAKDKRKCPKFSEEISYWWWLCTRSTEGSYSVAYVDGRTGAVDGYGDGVNDTLGVRPALKLDLSKVTFDSDTKTFVLKPPKTAQTVTAPTAATGLTYQKDKAQELLTSGASVTTGNTTEGSVQYKVGADGTWSAEIPKGTNAGTYSVYYRVLEDETYAEYAPAEPITVTIAKANPETPTGLTGKYGQKLSTVSLSGGWSWDEGDNIMNAGVGDYKYKANYNPTDADATNYNSLSNVDLTVKVGKGDGTISFSKTEVESTIGAEPPSVYFESTGDGVVTFTSDHENVATVNDNGYLTIIGVGETTITASVVDSATYQYATKSVSYKLIVNKRSVSIKTVPTASEITYGQTLANSTLSGGEVLPNIEGTFSWVDSGVAPAVSDSETTEYAVKFTPKNSDIYAESTCKVKVKVKKAAAPATKESLSPEQKPAAKNADELVYTGEPIELVTAPTNPLEGYKVQYSKDNGTTWTDTIPTETNVGTYTVKVKYVSDNYENIDLDDITVEITTVEKAAFNAEKEVQKKTADNLAADGDSDASKKLIEDAKKAIDELAYDETKSLDENKAALAAIVSKLKDELTAKRAEEKKEADDTAAAKKVTDAVNALPASDKVATTDKEAIEAARKAYDALTADQKAKVSAETLKKLEEAEKALAAAEKKATNDAKKSEGKNEWIDGQWYGADGNTEYKAKGSWKQNDKGWWYEDTDGWYPVSQWQKIDGKWYYFTADGYMDYSEYRDGYWLGSNGAWDETYSGGHWMQDATGWWYVDATGWYPVNRYLWVDGVQYWFNANGYWE